MPGADSTADAVGVIEAIYEDVPDTLAWLRRLTGFAHVAITPSRDLHELLRVSISDITPEGESREATTSTVHAIDRRRQTPRRRNPPEAVELWRALVAGRWSLVDHFDHDGRRFLVARRNPPNAPPLGTLSPREHRVLAHLAAGHTNKVIAYELGLSASAVAMQLARIMRRLGVRSRVELISAYRAVLGAGSPTSTTRSQ